MILDKLKNAELYFGIGEGIKKGFDFIRECKEKGDIEVGTYEIDGKNVFSKVQEYNSKEEAKFEAHEKYIDIQYVFKGNEKMYYEPIDKCEIMTEYNPDKDVKFYKDTACKNVFVVNEDEFAIFFPEDVHKPGMKNEESIPVKKILIKVHI